MNYRAGRAWYFESLACSLWRSRKRSSPLRRAGSTGKRRLSSISTTYRCRHPWSVLLQERARRSGRNNKASKRHRQQPLVCTTPPLLLRLFETKLCKHQTSDALQDSTTGRDVLGSLQWGHDGGRTHRKHPKEEQSATAVLCQDQHLAQSSVKGRQQILGGILRFGCAKINTAT